MGLIGMEKRVRHVGGTFDVHSRPITGTMPNVSLPLPAAVTI
jgi:signal transduction histidine kinase